MRIRDHVVYRTFRLLMFVSWLLSLIPRLLMFPSWVVRQMAMTCIPKQVKQQALVSHRLDKKRNQKCRCGSKKKYKNCCWKKDTEKLNKKERGKRG